MKRGLSVVAAFLSVLSAVAVEIQNPSFDSDPETGVVTGWRAIGGWRIERGAGRNAGIGLVWEGKDIRTVDRLICPVTGWRHGEAYAFSIWYRTGDFTPAASVSSARLCMEWFDKAGKWLGGNYAPVVPLSRDGVKADWRRMEGVTRELPPETASVSVQIYVSKGCSGRIQWDNVLVEPLNREPVEFVASSAYRDTAAAGRVEFVASLGVTNDAQASFVWTDAGNAVCRKVVPIADAAARLTLDVENLRLGRQNVRCTVSRKGAELGSAEVAFTRVSDLPRRRVEIDAKGRCLVDGKPFFPLGMYAWQIKPDWLKTYAAGPFNCIMPYGRTGRKELDLCGKAGVKAIAEVGYAVYGRASSEKLGLDTPEKSDAFILRDLEQLKDHPALLAWYLNDESPPTQIPSILRAYRLIVQEDPDHPVWAVMDRTYDLRGFTPTCDVLGMDPYPIPVQPLRQISEFAEGSRRATFGLRPFWNVPQAFDKSWYWKDLVGKAHFPTVAELRSICWQHVAGGANGLVLYSFHDYLRRLKTQEEFDRCWGAACVIGNEVRRMIPVLLAEPETGITSRNPDLVCRAWRKDGSLYLLACNVSDRALEASVALPPGTWKRVRTEVGEPAQLDGSGTVRFSLPPIGVSFMRIDPKGLSLEDGDFTETSIPYGTHPAEVVDVWKPSQPTERTPLVIYVHGGGWTSGFRRDSMAKRTLDTCKSEGCAFMTADYRFLRDATADGLQPPVRGPMSDVADLIAFVQANARRFGIDQTRIGLIGGSAGACASLSVALSEQNRFGIRAVAAAWPQTSLDPVEMRQWVPNIAYGHQAFGFESFDRWMAGRDKVEKWIAAYSPAALLRKCLMEKSPMFILDVVKEPAVGELPKDPTHAAAFRLKFAGLCAERGVVCKSVPSGLLPAELIKALR